MPKWNSRTRAELKQALVAMGMQAPFADADFSGMTGAQELAISRVIHEATITVDESGTEAAAATAVIMEYGIPEQLVVDRPFIYVIRDVETGAILFVGRVVNPAA
jgi:serpin B